MDFLDSNDQDQRNIRVEDVLQLWLIVVVNMDGDFDWEINTLKRSHILPKIFLLMSKKQLNCSSKRERIHKYTSYRFHKCEKIEIR